VAFPTSAGNCHLPRMNVLSQRFLSLSRPAPQIVGGRAKPGHDKQTTTVPHALLFQSL
jgi:hypothetical protein